MELTELYESIVQSAAESEQDAPRYLVRFRDRALYDRLLEKMGRNAKQRTETESFDIRCGGLEPLDSFPALRGPLGSPERLAPYSRWLDVEPDRRLYIEAKLYLPSSLGAAVGYNPAERIPWGVRAIRAPGLWRRSRGERVRIGVVDTGADYDHPDIRPALREGINLVQRHAPPNDDNGHGTHIAGTIAASAAHGGIRGVAPAAELYPIKAFDREGAAYVSDIILAIQWCMAQKIDVINMSFGMAEHSDSLVRAVNAAYRRGLIIVASSGNSGKPGSVDYPARLANTIGVGAVNRQGRPAEFSNRGKEVDIYAPGEEIYSSWLGRRYHILNGTSMAAAHVSGVVALLLAAKPGVSFSRLRSALQSSAAPLASGSRNGAAGRLLATGAWKALHARGRKTAAKANPKRRSLPIASARRKRPSSPAKAAAGLKKSSLSARSRNSASVRSTHA